MKTNQKNIIVILLLLIQPARALGFGSGLEICTPPVEPVTLASPTVISEFTQSALQAALDSGGQIKYPTKIILTF